MMPTQREPWSRVLTKRYLLAETRAGRSTAQIAASAGCSENTVRDQMARYRLAPVQGAPSSLAADYEHLGSIAAVGAKHGVSFATARRWLLTLEAPLNEAHRPKSADVDVRQAAKRYEQGESLASIAADIGVGVNTLKRRLAAAGVTMRPRGRPARSDPA